MEEQRGNKNDWLPWLLMGLGLMVVVLLLSRGCNDTETEGVKSTVHGSTARITIQHFHDDVVITSSLKFKTKNYGNWKRKPQAAATG